MGEKIFVAFLWMTHLLNFIGFVVYYCIKLELIDHVKMTVNILKLCNAIEAVNSCCCDANELDIFLQKPYVSSYS